MRAALRHFAFARTLNLGAGDLRWFALTLAVFGIQRIGVSRLGQDGGEALLRRTIFFVTTAILIVLAFHFRRIIGAWFIAAGIAMNFAPIVSHGGLMPVSWELIRDSGEFPQITEADIGRQVPNSKDIVLLREDIRFEPLSDRFFVTVPVYGSNIYSLGDFVAFGGIALAVVQILIFVAVGDAAPTRKPVDKPAL